jgi:hypothetical protein
MIQPGPPETPGNAEHVRGLLATLLRYAEVRGKLFKIESQEASSHVSHLLSRIIIGTLLLTVAWLLAVPALVMLIADAMQRPWQQVALVGAGLHLLFGVGFLNAAKRRWQQVSLFEESLNQFQKDREWASRHQTPPN